MAALSSAGLSVGKSLKGHGVSKANFYGQSLRKSERGAYNPLIHIKRRNCPRVDTGLAQQIPHHLMEDFYPQGKQSIGKIIIRVMQRRMILAHPQKKHR